MNDAEPMAYIARAPCGCIKLATVDTPDRAKDNGKQIAACITDGYTVERVTCEYVRKHWTGSCAICRRGLLIQGVMEL
jgi:hypothetical protein